MTRRPRLMFGGVALFCSFSTPPLLAQALPGVAGDIPVRGDFDGDHISDLAVYRPSTGYWYILKSITNFTTYVGLSSNIPID